MGYAWHKYRGTSGELGDVVTDKEKSANAYAGYFYSRLLQMFEYQGLPDTIPKDFLEYYLLRNGSCFITEVNSQLWAFIGNPGGEPDPYYRPTLYVCANPALGVSFQKKMWENEGVFCVNDSMWLGLDPMIRRYSYLMAENLISMRSADIMLRIVALLSAHDDTTKQSADVYLENLVDGKLSAIGDNPFFEGITLQSPPSNNGNYLTQFIELHQYYKGSFYNEIGLRANFNMKREAIGVGEAALGEDSLLPLCDNMLNKRKEWVQRVNDLYGTEIVVDYSSIWQEKRKEAELEMESKEAELETIKLENEGKELENERVENENQEDGEKGEEGAGEAISEFRDDMDGDGDGESNEGMEPSSSAESESEVEEPDSVGGDDDDREEKE